MRELNGTQAAVLAYLTSGSRSGWDIGRGLDALVGEFWNVTPSQVYRELHKMAAGGLVEASSSGPRDRRPYSITGDGRAALRTWLAAEPASDVVRIPLLLKLFLSFGDDDGRTTDADIARNVEAYRREHEGLLERYTATLAELERSGAPHAHVARYGVYHERAVIAWLDTLPWSIAPPRKVGSANGGKRS